MLILAIFNMWLAADGACCNALFIAYNKGGLVVAVCDELPKMEAVNNGIVPLKIWLRFLASAVK